jgi:hypothetical protein
MSSQRLKVVGIEAAMAAEEGDFEVASTNVREYVPEGQYDLVFESFKTSMMSFPGSPPVPKLEIAFQIADPSKFAGVLVSRFYNVKDLKFPIGEQGKFSVNPNGDFVKEFFKLFPESHTRLDRLAMSRFKGEIIVGRVVTVNGPPGNQWPEISWYSRIEKLERIKG